MNFSDFLLKKIKELEERKTMGFAMSKCSYKISTCRLYKQSVSKPLNEKKSFGHRSEEHTSELQSASGI